VNIKMHFRETGSSDANWIHLCWISGFHGGDYEECHILGYENPVRTSQETHDTWCRAQPVNAM
jgi:hypothetical protein